jgi:hypothetical protein
MKSIKYMLFDTKSAKMFHRSTEIFMQGAGEKNLVCPVYIFVHLSCTTQLGLYIQLHRKGSLFLWK